MGKWHILYLRTRNRSKLGWFFWFGLIHVTIRRNLDIRISSEIRTVFAVARWIAIYQIESVAISFRMREIR